ncbi:MAG TPA: ABC transporter permease [Euzebyales bacterium]|nr:ABC transporter permease [Euzebyales bacterium]
MTAGGGTAAVASAQRAAPRSERIRRWLANPWARPRWLAAFTLAYMVWALVPVLIAIQFSFNAGRSRSTWQGFSLRWYLTDPALSVLNDPSLRLALLQSLRVAVLTMLIATPLGIGLAVGLARWRGPGARAANTLMLFPLVTPEIVMGVALFLVFTNLFGFVSLGTPAQLLGHVTFTLSYVVVVLRGRLFAVTAQYEEAAMDLGASRWQAMRLVLLPLLMPAIFAALALVFAISIDDFVISAFLVAEQSSVTLPVRLYSSTRLGPTPALNALATILLLITLSAIMIAGLALRRSRRRTGDDGSAVEDLAQLDM